VREQVVINQKGSTAGGVFGGLFLFFVVLPVVVTVGSCAACVGGNSLVFHELASSATTTTVPASETTKAPVKVTPKITPHTARWISAHAPSAPAQPRTNATAAVAPDATYHASDATYKVVREWPIPNGGKGRVVVISPANRTEHGLRALGDELRANTRSDRNAVVQVYDDAHWAAKDQDALVERLSPKDLTEHDRHLVGQYMRNGNNGFHQLTIMLEGSKGPLITVDY
jgi:hypothetical protein